MANPILTRNINRLLSAGGIAVISAPERLNGFLVVDHMQHDNGYHTVLVHMPENTVTPYCVATWWPELVTGWTWGHYCHDRRHAHDEFKTVATRNRNRGGRS